MRCELIDNRKKHIIRILWESRYIQDQEYRSALKDKEATGYLDLAVLGDEESEVEDNNSDSEAGEAVEELKKG